MTFAPAPPHTNGSVAAPAPEQAGTAAPPPAPAPRRSGGAGLGLLLVAFGLLALAGNVWHLDVGALIGRFLFLGLGLAFVVARFTRGSYGLAVPAGILLGFGTFVALEEANILPSGRDAGAWFFLLLALGFAVIYPLGGDRRRLWPFYPAAGLAAFALFLLVLPSGLQLAEYLSLGSFWPVTLLAVGAWLLARSYLPTVAGRALGIMVLACVLAYAAALAASFAAYYEPDYRGPRPAMPAFLAPYVDSATLSAPIGAGDTLRITNTSGQVTIRPGAAGEVRVEAIVTAGPDQVRPEPRLMADPGVVTLAAAYPTQSVRNGGRVDFLVDVPPGTRLAIQNASGNVDVRGITAPVDVETASGDVRLHAPSGRVDGSIQTASGDARVYFAPGASASVDVRTSSGRIDVDGSVVRRQGGDQHSFTGSVGDGAGHLTVSTASGAARLDAERGS